MTMRKFAEILLLITLFVLPAKAVVGLERDVKISWRVLRLVLISGAAGTFDETAVKDPSVVFYEGRWHVFYTARGKGKYTTGYVTAESFNRLQSAPRHELKQIRGQKSRYACAPQVFFFQPQGLWYMVYQTKDSNYQPVYSTTKMIDQPKLWTKPTPLLKKDDKAKWIDFWVICDKNKAYLFYTRAHRDVYVRTTALEDFPKGWGAGKKVFSGVHEAVHIYKVKGLDEYHMIYEIAKSNERLFRFARAEHLEGPWKKVFDSFAAGAQLHVEGNLEKWTNMVSHGEILRSGYDQNLEYDADNPQIVIQGLLRNEYKGPYPNLPWKLGIIKRMPSVNRIRISCPANVERYSAYLMAYFGPEEKLFYAVSRDARNWTALNNGKPVFDAKVRLRDPFLNRVKGKFHLVHTKGWDHPVIFRWESNDLIHWTGGSIKVVDDAKKRAWAPEYFYCASEELFYVFWASIHNGHNAIHYVTTKDWKDITPARSAVYYDIGIHDIDLTIVEHKGTYYGFHKPGDVDDRMGNRLSTSTSLDPKKEGFGKDGYGKDVFPDQTRPTEGPEVIRLIGEDKWYIYGDPFRSPLEAWETNDFVHYTKIPVSTPDGAKHCSMIQITQAELDNLLRQYGPKAYRLEGKK